MIRSLIGGKPQALIWPRWRWGRARLTNRFPSDHHLTIKNTLISVTRPPTMHWLLDTRPWLAASRHLSIIPLTTTSTTSSSRLRKAPLVRNNISQNLLNPRSPPRNLANPANFPKSSAEFWQIQHPMLEGAHICEPLRHDKVRKERDAHGRRRPPLG